MGGGRDFRTVDPSLFERWRSCHRVYFLLRLLEMCIPPVLDFDSWQKFDKAHFSKSIISKDKLCPVDSPVTGLTSSE